MRSAPERTVAHHVTFDIRVRSGFAAADLSPGALQHSNFVVFIDRKIRRAAVRSTQPFPQTPFGTHREDRERTEPDPPTAAATKIDSRSN